MGQVPALQPKGRLYPRPHEKVKERPQAQAEIDGDGIQELILRIDARHGKEAVAERQCVEDQQYAQEQVVLPHPFFAHQQLNTHHQAEQYAKPGKENGDQVRDCDSHKWVGFIGMR